MLKHINKQLSKSELHEVETHMLDCELCSDAYAGLSYTDNSSMLFAIDNQIDKRFGKANKAPVMRNLMLAASVLAIVFSTLFMFNYFNETINNDGEIALNNAALPKAQEQLETIMSHSTEQATETEEEYLAVENEENKTVVKREFSESEIENEVAAEAPVLIETEDDMIEDVEASPAMYSSEMDGVAEFVEMEEEVVLENKDKEELAVANKYTANNSVALEDNEGVAVKSEKRKMAKKRAKNTRDVATTKTMVAAEPAVSELSAAGFVAKQHVLIIDGYKVVDYLDEYQKAYDDESALKADFNSVSAGYETEDEKVAAEKVKEEIVVEITYKEMLEQAIRSYKNQQYKKAIGEFDVILAKHANEVNAQFYSGLCYYHLGQNASAMKMFNTVLKNKETEFNEETNWYKALTFIQMNDNTAAKKLLNQIVKKEGFYKTKAEEKLRSL
ncbi:MAG: tetratricopeptide repeat protein [Vicingaceae bacterium]